jgi:Ulp1 family protease
MKGYEPKGFKGVFSSDQLPELTKQVSPKDDIVAVILNTDPSHKKGKHWVSLFIDTKNDKSVEYYDSFGEDPPKLIEKDLKKLIEKLDPSTYLKYKINRIVHQRTDSDTCGYHAMMFLVSRMEGKPFKECSGYSDVMRGEKRAKQFANKIKLPKFPLI